MHTQNNLPARLRENMQTIVCTKAESIELYNNYIDFNDLHNYEHAHGTSNTHIACNETKKIMVNAACSKADSESVKSVLNLQMTYIIIAHIYEQWDR